MTHEGSHSTAWQRFAAPSFLLPALRFAGLGVEFVAGEEWALENQFLPAMEQKAHVEPFDARPACVRVGKEGSR